jgi:SEC-C motif
MAIEKSIGQTRSEQYLSHLCDRTFLRPWSYANPYKAEGKELCDLIAIFENKVFLFFDRESRKFDHGGDMLLTWERWKKEAITKQVRTAAGAKRYVLANRNHIFLDPKGIIPLPPVIPPGELLIHKIVVAHGAKEACERFSASNIYGSLGVTYGDDPSGESRPFIVALDRTDPVHLLDSHNLELILGELDTLYDLHAHLSVKENAIRRHKCLTYCGEEDLLAHYFLNFDPTSKAYSIGVKDEDYDGLMIGEGEWHDFVESATYKRRKVDNRISYSWDRLIQKTGQNALMGVLGGNSDLFGGKSAIYEMAKEPRLSRRALSTIMANAIKNFPDNAKGAVRHLSYMPSFFPDTGYVFLQLYQEKRGDYDTEYRPLRRSMLEFACGATKLKCPHLIKVIGIAIDAPKYSRKNSEDFVLLDCANWNEEDQAYYEEANHRLQFFQTDAMKQHRMHVTDFPSAQKPRNVPKIGRNQLCPCGSGKKYKQCHGLAA